MEVQAQVVVEVQQHQEQEVQVIHHLLVQHKELMVDQEAHQMVAMVQVAVVVLLLQVHQILET